MARRKNLAIPPVGTPVIILWEDAAFVMDTDESHGTTILETMGWVFTVSRTQVSLVGERSQANDYHRAVTSIPRSLVRGVTIMSEAQGGL